MGAAASGRYFQFASEFRTLAPTPEHTMLRWLRRTFWPSFEDKFDMLLEKVKSGELVLPKRSPPTIVTKALGTLKVPSRAIALADPQYLPGLVIRDLPEDMATISAIEWHYSDGGPATAALILRWGELCDEGTWKAIGNVGIDSACVVVADLQDYETHWTEQGPDRIGFISTARNDHVLKLLTQRFKLRTTRDNGSTVNIIGPVSEALEQEIVAFLESIPEYATLPFMHFWVRTNKSFERANESRGFMPLGNAPTPLMFVGETGDGDGTYEVQGRYVADTLREVKITFKEEGCSLSDSE